MVRDARIADPPEVVVEELPVGRPAVLGPVQHRVVLQEVLPALDGPDLPAVGPAGHVPCQRGEVGGAGRGPRVEDQDVARRSRAELEDPDLVVLRGGAGGRVAIEPLERGGHLTGRCGRAQGERGRNQRRNHRHAAACRRPRSRQDPLLSCGRVLCARQATAKRSREGSHRLGAVAPCLGEELRSLADAPDGLGEAVPCRSRGHVRRRMARGSRRSSDLRRGDLRRREHHGRIDRQQPDAEQARPDRPFDENPVREPRACGRGPPPPRPAPSPRPPGGRRALNSSSA